MATDTTLSNFSLEVDGDGVGWVTFDQPDSRVNLLDLETMEELDELLTHLESRVASGQLHAVVVRSGKEGSFIAGADVGEIADLTSAEDAASKARQGQRIFRRLERLAVPSVAAVDGTCLGGGTELALACDFRIASERDATKIGLPETQLGILPGFGGTVRLPRLCGIQQAMDIILAGKSVSAGKAERIGLVDRLADPGRFRDEVERFVGAARAGDIPRGGRDKSLLEKLIEDTAPGRALLFSIARRKTRKRTEGRYPAPLRALEVMKETYDLTLDEALEVEARALGELAVTPVSKNLVRIFQLRQAAKKALPPEAKERGREVEKVGVLGAGVMGGGIAELVASQDLPVVMKDIDREPLDDGLRHAEELLGKAARKGVFTEEEAEAKLGLIEGTLEYGPFRDVDLVIEAVVEQMAVKKQVLREAEEVLPEHAVFSTNTSSLSVAELASASSRPGQVVGLHFFNPVHKMPLVEVVRTGESDPGAVATAFGFALAMDKTPVLVADGPGFLVNRLLGPYMNEAGHLLAEGVEVSAVDEAIEEFGMPMGPFRLLDEVGLDVAKHVSGQLEDAFGERMRATDAVSRLLDDGRLGKKSGLGFYVYQDGDPQGVDPDIRELVSAPSTKRPSDEEIVRRCLYPMVNEAAFALEEGIVESAGDVDLAMIMGTGFPPFRGGPLRWADREGAGRIVSALRAYRDEIGPRFRPSDLLVRKAESGATFTDPVLA